MSNVTISLETSAGVTMVSNRFIDDYMKDANDAQIKIYLYLLRMAGTGMPCGVSDIADHFNHTEKDVMRSLKYWDKLHVITLSYDESKKIVGIRLANLCAGGSVSADAAGQTEVSSSVTAASTPSAASPSSSADPCSAASVSAAEVPVTVVERSFAVKVPPLENSSADAGQFDKSSITLDQLKAFKNREETSQLLFIVEQYLAKPLSASDIRSIFFMTDILHLSEDLIDYLVQYCVGRGKKDFRYMEKVAINWAESGITTPKQAASYARKYDKNTYTIMNALGKSTAPTNKEVEYINRWLKEFSFSMDIISQACERTVMATDKHRFEYADSILQSWYNSGVHTARDIKTADEAFQKRKSTQPAKLSKAASANNQFNNFTQNQYDYDALLEKIKIN